MTSQLTQCLKRDGTVVEFNRGKIESAVGRALNSTKTNGDPVKIVDDVITSLIRSNVQIPSIEGIQDIVELALMRAGHFETARSYIRYRKEHEEKRKVNLARNPLFDSDFVNYFNSDPYRFIVYLRTYARYIYSKGRRETWSETVGRYMSMMKDVMGNKLTQEEYNEIRDAILNMEVMPSMRLLQFSGPAAMRENICAYNCSFIAVESIEDIKDAMYICMCGVGVGFSVENQFISKLPVVAPLDEKTKLETHVIGDSKEGWCDALYFGLKNWFAGRKVTYDFSSLRPFGAKLRIMGGYSSGPEPLRTLLDFCEKTILSKSGFQLSSLDVHRIMCHIGQCVVVGGTRRSAMISISDLKDSDIRGCKSGQWWNKMPELSMSNNSAAYNEKPTKEEFDIEWKALKDSYSGERGIFNRSSFPKHLPIRRKLHLAGLSHMAPIAKSFNGAMPMLGTNPCGEILLQSKQFCNLSTIVCRPNDDAKTLVRKIRLATIIGTYQSTLTDFHYVSPKFKKQCEEERLLGVSMTGQADCVLLRDKPETILPLLKQTALDVNVEYAKRFGVQQSTCVTCVKPEGTTSELCGTSSGIHARYSSYYLRRIRIGASDSLFTFLKSQGVTYYPENGQVEGKASTYVLEFPLAAPKGAITEDEQTAFDRLNRWKTVKTLFTEHNPSTTVYIDEKEWDGVRDWVYNNFDDVCGLAFLPRDNGIYQLAPFQKIDENEYQKYPRFKIDWGKFPSFENKDHTDVKAVHACIGDKCYLI